MKLTPWFPANVKPVRVGVYEVRMKAACRFGIGIGTGSFGTQEAQVRGAPEIGF